MSDGQLTFLLLSVGIALWFVLGRYVLILLIVPVFFLVGGLAGELFDIIFQSLE